MFRRVRSRCRFKVAGDGCGQRAVDSGQRVEGGGQKAENEDGLLRKHSRVVLVRLNAARANVSVSTWAGMDVLVLSEIKVNSLDCSGWEVRVWRLKDE